MRRYAPYHPTVHHRSDHAGRRSGHLRRTWSLRWSTLALSQPELSWKVPVWHWPASFSIGRLKACCRCFRPGLTGPPRCHCRRPPSGAQGCLLSRLPGLPCSLPRQVHLCRWSSWAGWMSKWRGHASSLPPSTPRSRRCCHSAECCWSPLSTFMKCLS